METHKMCDCITMTHKMCDCIMVTYNRCDCITMTHKICDCIFVTHKMCDCITVTHKTFDCITVTHKMCVCITVTHQIHHNHTKFFSPKKHNLFSFFHFKNQSPCRWTQCPLPHSGILNTTWCRHTEVRRLNKAISEDLTFIKCTHCRSISWMGK